MERQRWIFFPGKINATDESSGRVDARPMIDSAYSADRRLRSAPYAIAAAPLRSAIEVAQKPIHARAT
jgi:hypothetical protein